MKFKSVNWKETATQIAGTFAGIVAGSFVDKQISENQAVEGLAGEAKDYLVPGIVAVGGALVSAASDNKLAKSFGFGVTAVGSAKILNRAAGKTVVSLGGVGSVRRMPRRIPQRMRGVGEVEMKMIPGVGRTYNSGFKAMPGMSGQTGCF